MAKKSFLTKLFVGLGKLIAFLVVNLFKAIYYVFVGLFKGLRASVNAAKSAHSNVKLKASQPKTPASYNPLNSSNVVKGSASAFENRLLSDSLILAIAGRRGSGKSATGFRLLENIHAKTQRSCFVLGVSEAVLPNWITSIASIDEVANGGVVLVDEGAIAFSSRESMSKKNRSLAELLAIARHKDVSLIFITQNTGMIDKNVLNLCDIIMLKEGSLLQEKMERSVMKDLYSTANSALSKIESSERRAHCYVFDSDFEGLIQASLPSFWSSKVSKNRA